MRRELFRTQASHPSSQDRKPAVARIPAAYAGAATDTQSMPTVEHAEDQLRAFRN